LKYSIYFKFIGLFLTVIFVVFICSLIGSRFINLTDIVSQNDSGDLWIKLRLPRVILGFVAGACLSISGMAFQAVFRNPLAEPFTLGISAGSALGAVIYFTLGWGFSFLGIGGTAIFAFAGAVFSIIVVYGLSQIKKDFSGSTMLLSGIAINFFFSAVIMLFQFLGSQYNLAKIMHWTMGGLEIFGFKPINQSLFFVILGIGIILFSSRELNLFSAGEDIAVSRGVDTKKFKKVIFLAGSLMVGAVCAVCGPIAFVGMICPHICRIMFGWEHAKLSVACILFGGAFLVLCDTIARTIIAPVELPVGVITSILGGPFFVWLLLGLNKNKVL